LTEKQEKKEIQIPPGVINQEEEEEIDDISEILEEEDPPESRFSIFSRVPFLIALVVSFLHPKLWTIQMEKNSSSWKNLRWGKGAKLNYKVMPPNFDKLVLLESLKKEADGRLWSACDTRGRMCII